MYLKQTSCLWQLEKKFQRASNLRRAYGEYTAPILVTAVRCCPKATNRIPAFNQFSHDKVAIISMIVLSEMVFLNPFILVCVCWRWDLTGEWPVCAGGGIWLGKDQCMCWRWGLTGGKFSVCALEVGILLWIDQCVCTGGGISLGKDQCVCWRLDFTGGIPMCARGGISMGKDQYVCWR